MATRLRRLGCAPKRPGPAGSHVCPRGSRRLASSARESSRSVRGEAMSAPKVLGVEMKPDRLDDACARWVLTFHTVLVELFEYESGEWTLVVNGEESVTRRTRVECIAAI